MTVEEQLRETFRAQLEAQGARHRSVADATLSPNRPGQRWFRPLALGLAATVVAVVAAALILSDPSSDQRLDTVDSPTTPESTVPGVPTAPTRPPSSTEAAPATADSKTPSSAAAGSTGAAADPTFPAQEPVESKTPAGINRAGGLAVAVSADGTGDVVAIDLSTGAVDATIATLDLEARWIGRIQLDWAGTALYYQAQTEDYWFSCESSPGSIMRLDLVTGVEARLAAGAEPQVSPDGTRLAYLAASQCLPDPVDPANFWVTPYDTVVVRDLATGRERSWLDPDLAASLTEAGGDVVEGQLGGLQWLGPDELAVGAQRLSPETMEVIGTGADLRAEAGGLRRVLGLDQETGLVLIERDLFDQDGRRRQLVGVDPDDGTTTVFAVTESVADLSIVPESGDGLYAFDTQHDNLAVVDGARLSIDGRQVTLDVEVSNLDW